MIRLFIITTIVFVVVAVGIGYYVIQKQSQVTETPESDVLREQACPSPAMACQSPEIPSCQNGKWVCIGPAIGEANGATTGGKIASNSFIGQMLAGSQSPLLDFTKADYDMALKTDKLVVLYFYANWCPICKAEFPIMQKTFNELATDQVIGFRVNYKDDQTDSDEVSIAREFGVAYQHTKVFVKNGERILKSPEGWDGTRYASEINKALNQ